MTTIAVLAVTAGLRLVVAAGLADAGLVVTQVDAVVGDVVDVLGVATVGDADTAATTVDCSGRQLVR